MRGPCTKCLIEQIALTIRDVVQSAQNRVGQSQVHVRSGYRRNTEYAVLEHYDRLGVGRRGDRDSGVSKSGPDPGQVLELRTDTDTVSGQAFQGCEKTGTGGV